MNFFGEKIIVAPPPLFDTTEYILLYTNIIAEGYFETVLKTHLISRELVYLRCELWLFQQLAHNVVAQIAKAHVLNRRTHEDKRCYLTIF